MEASLIVSVFATIVTLSPCLAIERMEFPLLMPDVQPLQVSPVLKCAACDLMPYVS